MNLNSGAEKEKKEIRGLNIKWFFYRRCIGLLPLLLKLVLRSSAFTLFRPSVCSVA